MSRAGGYGAALAMTPYLLIKVSWVVGALAGVLPTGSDASVAEWVVLNGVTIVMAAVGIVLALALVRPWGMRIPAPPLALAAWVGAGFLVSVLPFALVTTVAGDDDSGDMPAWEGALIQAAFVTTGLGLALALPGYVRRRWPHLRTGRLGAPARRWVLAAGALPGVCWLYWAAGGTVGLAHPDQRDADWRMLTLLGGLWALTATAAVWARPPRRLPLVALGWLGSGSLFAWSGWKLPLTGYVALAEPADAVPPEHPAVAAALHAVAVVAGVSLLRVLTRGTGLRRDEFTDHGRNEPAGRLGRPGDPEPDQQ
ncbi:hypothetical protein [Streptomyces sp. NPDC127098]|uniref:hypothetical protein n=1 Tax=Streptomyces sp. NPDC127098 TaxID=3347137 RepID=UPI00366722A4